jgi:hypothetical protein
VGVGLEAVVGGDAVADGDHRAPLGEASAHLVVLGEAVTQAVEALGDLLARVSGQVLGAGVDFDSGDDAQLLEELGERCAVAGALADGFVVEDDAAHVLLHALGGEEHLPVGPAVLFGGFDGEGGEALADGR